MVWGTQRVAPVLRQSKAPGSITTTALAPGVLDLGGADDHALVVSRWNPDGSVAIVRMPHPH